MTSFALVLGATLALLLTCLLVLDLAPGTAFAADPDPTATTAVPSTTTSDPSTTGTTVDPFATSTTALEPSTTTTAVAVLPDTTPPAAAITDPEEGAVLSGDVNAGTRMHVVRGTASDDIAVVSVKVAIDGQLPIEATTEGGEGTSNVNWSYTWFLPTEDNAVSHTLDVTATDAAGNSYTSPATTVRVDTLAPVVASFSINQSAAYTSSTTVSLDLLTSDGSLPLELEVANETTAFPGAWKPYASPYPWSLEPGDGLKTVYGRVRDAAGNVSGLIWDEITLDASPPAVVSTDPASEASQVSLVVVPRVTFSDEMDPLTTAGSIELWKDADGNGTLETAAGQDVLVPGEVTFDPMLRSADFAPASPLLPQSKYFISVKAGAKNAAGQSLPDPFVSGFYTGGGDTTPPAVVSVSPQGGTSDVSTLGIVILDFSEPMDFSSLASAGGFALFLGTARVSGQLIADSPTRVTFYPDAPLDANSTYSVVLGTNSRDLSGNSLATNFTSQFTTVETTATPHGGYTSNGGSCRQCHLVHGSPEPGPAGGTLLVHENENALCKTCHDGRGASKDVNTDFVQGTSGHFLEDGQEGEGRALTSRCSSCHGPHFASSDNPGQFRPEINGQPVTGNNTTWCLACHDDANSWAGENYPYPAGGASPDRPVKSITDNRGYPVSGTFPGKAVYLGASNAHAASPVMVWPGSNRPAGDCRNCHTAHSSTSPYDGLIASYRPTPDPAAVLGDRQNGTYADLCLTCHDGEPSTKNIKQFVTFDADKSGPQYTGGHRIMTAGGNLPVGAPLPCYDCHNPHGSKGNAATQPQANKHLVSDEQWSGIDTSTTAGVVNFCTKCHLPWEYVEGSGQIGFEGRVPDGQLESIEGLIRWKADNKLSLTPGALGHSRANMENPTASCYACHGNSYAAPTATSGFNVHRPGAGQGCAVCHAGPVDAGDGAPARRAVSADFSLGGGHHVDGSVTDQDCGVCHLEGDPATGEINAAVHKNNALDLRNPDTGDSQALPPFQAFSRDTSSSVLEPWVVAVQNNLCLRCHDADGAASATARTPGGTNQRPFSASPSEAAADVFSALDPSGNGFHHAVRAPGGNEYATASAANGGYTTMAPPWNQAGEHNVISCFDCHETSAGHGGRYGRIARTDIGNPPSAPNYTGMVDLCLRCHASAVYQPLDTQIPSGGSRFAAHQQTAHTMSGSNTQGCRGCHAGLANSSGLGANGAPGNIHGGSFIWPADSPTPGSGTARFLYGGYLSGWQGGTCASSCHGSRDY